MTRTPYCVPLIFHFFFFLGTFFCWCQVFLSYRQEFIENNTQPSWFDGREIERENEILEAPEMYR